MPRLRWKDVVAAAVMQEHGRSVRGLARDLGVDESTLRYRLKRHRAGIEDGRRHQPEACSEWHEVIMSWIDARAGRGRPEPVKALYEQLVCEQGFTGSYKAVLRYVRRRVPRPLIRPCRRIEVRPGSQAQVDWFEVPVFMDDGGGIIKLHAFVMALSFSRMWAVVWSRSMDMAAWVQCHNEAFRRLGGVPASIRIDNLRTGVASGAGPWAVINEGYADYARQMCFVVDPARARTGSDKGKVERRGQDVKRIPLVAGERFRDLADLQRVTDARVRELSGELICPVTGMSIFESFRREFEHLQALPLTLPEAFDVQVSRMSSPFLE
ncbi:MAG: IS21 family transposase [Dehalococcoidia bacterium]|nr:IS21 family transposase [Dehalococcoidia bacterium]